MIGFPDEGAEGGGESWDALAKGDGGRAETRGGALLSHEALTGFPALYGTVGKM